MRTSRKLGNQRIAELALLAAAVAVVVFFDIHHAVDVIKSEYFIFWAALS